MVEGEVMSHREEHPSQPSPSPSAKGRALHLRNLHALADSAATRRALPFAQRRGGLGGVLLICAFACTTNAAERARDLGVPFEGTPGALNAITDVAGVQVGQVTLIEDRADGRKVRTGVTAILPRGT